MPTGHAIRLLQPSRKAQSEQRRLTTVPQSQAQRNATRAAAQRTARGDPAQRRNSPSAERGAPLPRPATRPLSLRARLLPRPPRPHNVPKRLTAKTVFASLRPTNPPPRIRTGHHVLVGRRCCPIRFRHTAHFGRSTGKNARLGSVPTCLACKSSVFFNPWCPRRTGGCWSAFGVAVGYWGYAASTARIVATSLI